MMGYAILLGLVAALVSSCWALEVSSRPARRRRDARALRAFVLHDVEAGRTSAGDALIDDVLTWCDDVVVTGRDLPLVLSNR